MTEQGIVFEAPSAAAARDHFRLQGIHIQRHQPAHQRIQILEGNCRRMEGMHRFQRVESRVTLARIADAIEIGIQVKRGGHDTQDTRISRWRVYVFQPPRFDIMQFGLTTCP